MSFDFGYGLGFFGLLLPIGMAVVTYLIYFWIIKVAINKSNMTTELYALRQDLNELERRQSDRFTALDAHFQEQNMLLREQNELLLQANRNRM